jgi:integrase
LFSPTFSTVSLVTDIAPAPEGLRVTIRSSKTDQEGHSAVVAVSDGRRLRPVARLQDWTARAGITDGYLFRRISKASDHVLAEPMTGQSVARVVQRRVAETGLDTKDFSGHSLRAGFLTSSARAGGRVGVQDARGLAVQGGAGAGRVCPPRP